MEIHDNENVIMNDTDYLNSIPGLAESLIEASKTPIEECVNADDIEW